MGMMDTPRVHHVDVLLRCSKDEHGDCAVLRDALFENFRQVTSAYTAKTEIDTDYCVSASAIVRHGDIDRFGRRLKALRSAGAKASKTKMFVSS